MAMYGETALIEQLHVVKVAHHGSKGAFHAPAWDLHARADGVAIVAPFNKGKTPPPHTHALRGIRRRFGQLALTAGGRGARGAATSARWAPIRTARTGSAPCVCVVLDASGVVDVVIGRDARLYRS